VKFLTDFADQAVVLPLVLAIAVALALQGWRRGAVVWLLTVAATFTTMLLLKFAFLACTPVLGPLDIRSPSGHVAGAAIIGGGLAAVLTRRPPLVLPTAALAALVIGISRLWLGAHSLPEVLLGGAVGLGGVALLQRLAGRPPRLWPVPLAATVVVVAIAFHGLHLPAEAAIRHTAIRAAYFIPACRPKPAYSAFADRSARLIPARGIPDRPAPPAN
jgi:membrane-associated phospholipid phosphatase